MDAVMTALTEVFKWDTLILMAVAVTAGIVTGAIPGFTITMAVALALPFTFGMDPITGVAVLMSVVAGGASGGLIPACLLGIPGTPSAIATVFDGYPMVKNGEPGKALAVGLWSGFFGMLIAGVALILFAPMLAEWALEFGPWEMFALMFFGMTAIASVAGDSLAKGLFAGFIGLLFACVGMDPVLGQYRFTFGWVQLYGGFNFLPVLVGIFAFSQLLEDMLKSDSRPKDLKIDKDIDVSFPIIATLKLFTKQKMSTFVSSVVGIFVGVLPAAGGSIANIMAYDVCKKSSKHPELYGTGIPDGIIASEASNNAVMGGDLIPTLSFGIPGDATTAMLLGALMIHGIQPGPMLMVNQPVLVNSVFVSFFVAAFLMLLIQQVGLRLFIRVNDIPQHYLVPLILALCCLGSYAVNNRIFDVWVLIGFGLLGFILKMNDYPLAPVILGIILGPMMEANFRRAIMTSSDYTLFFTRPISCALILLGFASIAYSLISAQKVKKREMELERELEAVKNLPGQ